MSKFEEKDEFYELYERNVDTVYQIAYMHLRNRSDAQDAVQNIFLKYLDVKPAFENDEHEKAWFIVASRNHCRDVLRTWWKRKRTEDAPEQIYESFGSDEEGEITQVLMKLPAKYREILYLYYYKEYSLKEISVMLKIKESTLRTQMCRARERMKKHLEEEETGYGQKRSFERV